MLFEERFLLALALTITIETIVLLALARFFLKKEKLETKAVVFAGFLASFSTLPYLWFVLPPFVDSSHYIIIGETIAVAIESVIIRQMLKIGIKKALVASIACNAVSFFFGQLAFKLV